MAFQIILLHFSGNCTFFKSPFNHVWSLKTSLGERGSKARLFHLFPLHLLVWSVFIKRHAVSENKTHSSSNKNVTLGCNRHKSWIRSCFRRVALHCSCRYKYNTNWKYWLYCCATRLKMPSNPKSVTWHTSPDSQARSCITLLLSRDVLSVCMMQEAVIKPDVWRQGNPAASWPDRAASRQHMQRSVIRYASLSNIISPLQTYSMCSAAGSRLTSESSGSRWSSARPAHAVWIR